MQQNKFNAGLWVRFALINFCIVALAGITLRYKINFPLPGVNQKYLLHAHSHFAFTGWIASVLMALVVHYLQQHQVTTNYKKYHWTLWANCIVAYGMLFSFIVQGYALFSITFSTLSIIVSYFFIVYLWRDLNKIVDPSYATGWFKAGLFIWAISSLGAFTLAYLMANRITVQDYYFAAVYFFLHFQYNGWILFVCFGLLFHYLHRQGYNLGSGVSKKLFMVMALTVGPAYLLSILWLKLPKTLHLLGTVAGVFQLVVLFYFIQLWPIVRKNTERSLAKITRYLWTMAFIAFIIKVLLQVLSVIPALSEFAFGFRPIVIGYLHLSFLGIITFFILGYINQLLHHAGSGISRSAVLVFVVGVLSQEIILMVQGLEVMQFEKLPYANIILFGTAVVMGTGLVWITASVWKTGKEIGQL